MPVDIPNPWPDQRHYGRIRWQKVTNHPGIERVIVPAPGPDKGETMAQCGNDNPMMPLPLPDLITEMSGPPGSNKPLIVEPVDEKTQAVYDAQQYIKDYDQWLVDHPGKTPPEKMTKRYTQEQLFVAKNFRL